MGIKNQQAQSRMIAATTCDLKDISSSDFQLYI
jgi:hypothetical protein